MLDALRFASLSGPGQALVRFCKVANHSNSGNISRSEFDVTDFELRYEFGYLMI